jgi:hypothetical protein
MSDKPKRKFWQFHLSTAVMVMLIAGLILFFNQQKLVGDVYFESGNLGLLFFAREVSYGWPSVVFGYREGLPGFPSDEWATRVENNKGTVLFPDGRKLRLRREALFNFTEGPTWKPMAIMGNLLVCALILIVVAAGSEFLARREARKT